MSSSLPTWRPSKKDWLLFSNPPPFASPPRKSPKSSFFFSPRKPESKGSLVYTPLGYGIIQSLSPLSQKILVKICKSSIFSEFSFQEVTSDIPLTLRIFSRNFLRTEEQITLPAHSTSLDLLEKIETLSCATFSSRIFFKGLELLRTSENFEKIGIFPNSRIFVISSLGKPLLVNRFATVYQGWGYSNSIDGVSFSASKDLRILGFGLYTADKEKTALSGILRFLQGNDAKNSAVFSKEFTLLKEEEEGKIAKVLLDRPYAVKSGEVFSCVVEIGNGNSFYGSSGQAVANGEGDVVFSFSECVGSMNGTSPSSGQIPEIYYYV